MSVRSNAMTNVKTIAGVYSLPSVRFGKGNQLLQIRENSIDTIEDLEDEVIALTTTATTQNNAIIALQNQTAQLRTDTQIELNDETDAFQVVRNLQQTLNQIDLTIQHIKEDNFSPYYKKILPTECAKGAGTINITKPTDPQAYTFTPQPTSVGNVINVPQAIAVLALPTYTTSVQYQITWNVVMLGDVRQEGLFYDTFFNLSNGGIVYTTIIDSLTQQNIYSTQQGVVGQTYIPVSSSGGSFSGVAIINYTDIVTIPANTSSITFGMFISSHFQMSLLASAVNPIALYISSTGFPMPEPLGAIPVIQMLKL